MRKLYLIPLIVLFVLPFVFAGQLGIESIKSPYLLANQGDINLYFNVFNSTGHNVSSPSTTCRIKILNESSAYLLQEIPTMEGSTYKQTLSDNITTNPGVYQYTIWCLNSNEAGYLSDKFEIANENSATSDVGGAPLAVIILLPMLLAFLIVVGANLLNEDHSLIKVFLYMFSLVLFFISLLIAMQTTIRYYGFEYLIETFGWSIWVIGIFMFVLLCYLLIYISSMIWAAIQAEIERKKQL